ncbi:MAG TPA: DsbE family thiol:disulfide interchange protein [Stellaceae bacterium]|nr:DsbE family thiol:disulfide interchange protein [Stellaceae bacterium]
MSEDYADRQPSAAGRGGPSPIGSGERPRRFQAVLLAPLVLFVGLFVAFGFGLRLNPSLVPSPLIGKPAPTFKLPPVQGRSRGLSSADLRGRVSLVNVFASWCVSCREEHPLLMRLKAEGIVPIYGIDYKDKPDDAARWLQAMGDPYARAGADLDGRVAIDWGVYGVPETFVVDRRGRIAFKQIGPIAPEVLDRTILPLIARLRAPRPEAKEGAR